MVLSVNDCFVMNSWSKALGGEGSKVGRRGAGRGKEQTRLWRRTYWKSCDLKPLSVLVWVVLGASQVRFLADGGAAFTKASGLEFDTGGCRTCAPGFKSERATRIAD